MEKILGLGFKVCSQIECCIYLYQMYSCPLLLPLGNLLIMHPISLEAVFPLFSALITNL